MVRLFASPIFLRAALVLFGAGGAFLFVIWLMRTVRRNIAAETDFSSQPSPTLEALPLHLYNTVIQQLKQQKHELQLQNQAEQRRARTTENFSQAVLSNLSSGVLVFGINGLVKQANPSAKEILGFNSPIGMGAGDIFRHAVIALTFSPSTSVGDPSDAPGTVIEEVNSVLREGSKCRQFESDYINPAGKQLRLAITISPVPAADGGLLGVALLITDRSELEQIRNQQELNREVSAEMALELRSSLATIAGYARQLSQNCGPELVPQLASDIASEAARLDRHIGGFLAEKHSPSGAAATHAGAGG